MLKPMLAATADNNDLDSLRFPLLASPKLDGFRALIVGGVVLSRNLKPIPNKFIQRTLGHAALDGFDGELIVGEPTAPLCFGTTSSGVTSVEGIPDFKFYVFDHWIASGGFYNRFEYLRKLMRHSQNGVWAQIGPSHRSTRVSAYVEHVPQLLVSNAEELLTYETEQLAKGFEGVMLRAMDGPYKHGRSTLREGYLLKLKRFTDGEAMILGYEERLHNANEATRNALGNLERSSHKANKHGTGVLGAFKVKDMKSGVEFDIGTGFDDVQRAALWVVRKNMIGKILKYKCFPVGAKDKPRFPVFIGFRDIIDI